ncbi:MAG: hypothetical protein CL810_07305 [Cobetia sp.]|jgi:uncharacterized protein YdgA (DUF945 family)|uniref:DUF945 family protein n=2 Tax=Cobetia TaxID=204286 RepID=UPI000C5885EA|nr:MULTISPECIES: DUF945 family protein [unclassified Cobetia]MBK09360.1 hypothetical protein [Cobetia sp.]MDH2297006.1 DUF945 family protein [Cobetia sp. 29-18-1]BBO57315.1 hypothetical protein CLAM6_26260 [Cobetia sp. AM6]HAR09396.1 hypothetical protein [Cobetia sp.]|tara:strand:- start:36668 stop:37948 length:1281 start_codon:yes stop_codon:yes gene_type:complete
MGKGLVTATAVVVIGAAGYVGGVAYSSQRFEDEMARMVAELDRSSDIKATREDVDSGWFGSTGRVEMELATGDGEGPMRIVLPYEAGHGLLSTTMQGNVKVLYGTPSRDVFAEVLGDGKAIAFDGSVDNFSGASDTTLTLPAFDWQDSESGTRIDFQGGELLASHDGGDTPEITVDGEITPFDITNGAEKVSVGTLSLNGIYRGADNDFRQDDKIVLDTLTIDNGTGQPPVVASDIRYSGETRLDPTELRYLMKLSVQDVSAGDQQMASGDVSISIDRLQGAAVYDFITQLQGLLEEAGKPFEELSEEQQVAILEKVEAPLFTMLSTSPRMTLESLNAKSDAFGVDMQGDGQMILDGADITDLTIQELQTVPGQQAFLNRLSGRFEFRNVPPMMAMMAGVSPQAADRNLVVEIDGDSVKINGTPIY